MPLCLVVFDAQLECLEYLPLDFAGCFGELFGEVGYAVEAFEDPVVFFKTERKIPIFLLTAAPTNSPPKGATLHLGGPRHSIRCRALLV